MAKEKSQPQPKLTVTEARNIHSSMLQVQTNAFRMKDDNMRINSLPVDLEIKLSEALSKMETLLRPFTESLTRIAKRNKMVPVNNGAAFQFPKDADPKLRTEVMKQFTEINESAVDVSGILPVEGFTWARIKESGIEFENCPEKQWFFKWCLAK